MNVINETRSSHFYKNLNSFTGSQNIMNENNYVPLPDDWSIVITDIKGSTKAIEAGRYKDVNVVGVATIISTQNACGDAEIPFIFGGDGATLFIPNEKVEAVKRSLAFSRANAASEFKLQLRVAIIPMSVLVKNNRQLLIAKMFLSGKSSIAMAKGDGLAFAEDLTKKSDDYLVGGHLASEGSHQGLECRWNPIVSKKGEMISMIIKVNLPPDQASEQYHQIISKINEIVPEIAPVTKNKLSTAWPPIHLFKEIKAKHRGVKKYAAYIATASLVLLLTIIVKLTKKNPNSLVSIYMNELASNTDFIKFDDVLRMVIDVDQNQKKEILEYLEGLEKNRSIKYGIHSSVEALMTCYVQSKTNHIHFIDGGSGGYAMAAKMMKAKQLGPA
ncbi:MAG: DUF3095 family protein [Bdellovibrionaceae bacterium]|nr:DUF3095 family protein [Bdellovibrio sp.]